MKKIRIFLSVLVMTAMLLSFASSPKETYAQSRYGNKVKAIDTSEAVTLPTGSWVYGISVYASSANAEFGVYDVATLAASGASNVKGEVGEATQYETTDKPFKVPIYFTNGVTGVVRNGVGFIEYGPEPS